MIAEIRKLLVALAAVLAAGVASGLLHGQAETYAEIGIAVLGLFGIYATRNGESAVEKRIADLEATVPGLPQLVDAMGASLGKALRPKPSPFPAGSYVAGGVMSPVADQQPVSLPPAHVGITTTQDADVLRAVAEAAAQKVLRDSRGRFARRPR